MDNTEARGILDKLTRELRTHAYSAFREWILESRETHHEIKGPSGVAYQVEVLVFWDAKPNQDIRVMVAIDDGGWRAFMPLSRNFIVTPDGSFVGE